MENRRSEIRDGKWREVDRIIRPSAAWQCVICLGCLMMVSFFVEYVENTHIIVSA